MAMNLPDKKLCELIDELEQSSVSFALYRLPWEKEPVLVLQREGALHTCAHLQGLNGKTGFVLAPFCPSEQHPVVIIRADRKAEGWAEIADALASIGMAKPVKDRLTSDRHVPAYTRRDYGEASDVSFNRCVKESSKSWCFRVVRQLLCPIPFLRWLPSSMPAPVIRA